MPGTKRRVLLCRLFDIGSYSFRVLSEIHFPHDAKCPRRELPVRMEVSCEQPVLVVDCTCLPFESQCYSFCLQTWHRMEMQR